MSLRRVLVAVTAAVATGALLAGCSSPAASPPASKSAKEAPKGDITFWSSLSGMADVAAAFNATHPDIKVTFEEIPQAASGGYTKLSAAIGSGTGPDVVGIEYPSLTDFVSSGQLTPLDELISAKTLGKYPKNIRSLVSFADQTYAMPYDAPPSIMWYRQDILEAAGVNEVPKSWDEYEQAAKAVKAWNPDAYLGSFFTSEPQLASIAWTAGATWFAVKDDKWKVTIDDKETMKAADWWQKLIDEGLVKKQPGLNDEWVADLQNDTVASWLAGSWSASSLKRRTEPANQQGKWIAALPPTESGKPGGALNGGTSFTIPKTSKNPEAAAVFLEWLTTTPESVTARGAVGTTYLAYPGLNDAAKAVAPTDYYANDIYAVFDEAYSHLRPWAWGPSYSVTYTAMTDAVASEPTIGDAVEKTQKATVTGLKQLGLEIAK
ncbi:MAG: sugar ABC transporter substrate-binding protein [Microbacterium sp.]|jgi:multiple sugar transport system substrate-binding protein|nr:sugar ABC transporter substrate-binding protein [Microbacterium sp.]